ncbi:3-phosphoshikimate 1-carboxyvinyltransferase [Sphingomonas sp. TZW2008]|uniref:3-phosphoshikimate 1-carboxyvinyltransferase n=1 Tax=Sphingomonas sp. TZW2008 TaxID=1917973 RepID=UPI000A26B639|nr:3-phosphoshikimate 1-carboxyvinyltransferase [Sphingomonas sp. TZW2008]
MPHPPAPPANLPADQRHGAHEATVHAAATLRGRIRVPGDKSISHRALMLSALAVGESRVEGLLEGEDVLATAAAMRAMGATITRGEDAIWRIHGVGVGGLLQPAGAVEMGNSGTSTRLLMGLVASHPITVTFTGDASLSGRPMKRVIDPLASMGADITASPGGRLPLMVRGLCPAVPISYELPVASAQVKSAVLLAGLNTPGVTRVIEPVATRDHSERMLAGFGATIEVEATNRGRIISITGEAELRPQTIVVPGDPSSAAFFMVAASVVPGSDVVVENVGLNPTRAGLLTALRLMGADITELDPRSVGGEPVADLRVRHAPLTGIEVPHDLAPSMIDEYPALFVAAAFAGGRTIARGADELRVKESDRIAVMKAALDACGVTTTEHPDGLTIEGSGGEPIAGGARIASRLDHRIAMSMAIAGLHARSPVTIDDASPVATSFPGFFALLETLGGTVSWT